jgi:hypothetical protein
MDGVNEVCFQHSKNIASAIGMQTRNLNTITVKERLRTYHHAILDNAIGDLKTGKDTYAWFRMTDRPKSSLWPSWPVQADAEGCRRLQDGH